MDEVSREAGARRVRSTLLRAALGAVPAAFAVAYAFRPDELVYAAAAASAAIALAAGIRIHRPANALGWYLVAAGLALSVAGDLAWWRYEAAGAGALPYPSLADVFYVGAYPSLVVGILLVTTHGRAGAVGALLDAGVVATCGGLFLWALVLEPAASPDASLGTQILTAFYPTADILVVCCVAQLLLVGRVRRVPAVHLALASVVLLFAADIGYSLASLHGTYAAGDPSDFGYLAAYAAVAWAALHPSVTALRPDAGALATTRGRFLVLALACLSAPVALVVQASQGRLHVELFAIWGSTLIVLVFVRMHLLLRRQRRGELALAEQERSFRAVFEHSLDAMLVTDEGGRYVDANDAACALLGRSRDEVLTLRVADVLRPGGQASGSVRGETTITRPDGTEVVVEYSASVNFVPGRHLAILRDVTERHELEERLRQSQKLEAIGRLAGGIAHDFNNLLTAIGGYGRLVLDEVGGDAPRVRRRVEEMVRAGDRAANLTSQLLAFSRRQVLQPVVFDLNDAVAEADSMLRRLLGEHIRIVTSLAPGGCPVRADRSQMEQVLLNLAVNARDAMPSGGTLAVETETAGRSVVLRVTDTGSGTDAATLEHAFEPFFTTKETGKGTGLGLATVHGIVHQSGGEITVESREHTGTTFEIRLPLCRDGDRGQSDGEPAPTGGTERILLVEDEAVVRELACEMLEGQGYDVVCACDPEQALDLAGRESIDALVTDVVMPKMNGRDLAARLRDARPGLPIVYTSGYSRDPALQEGRLEPGAAFLQKPFAAGDLGRAVRSVLAGAR